MQKLYFYIVKNLAGLEDPEDKKLLFSVRKAEEQTDKLTLFVHPEKLSTKDIGLGKTHLLSYIENRVKEGTTYNCDVEVRKTYFRVDSFLQDETVDSNGDIILHLGGSKIDT